jgi:hypothetical protein
MGTVALRIKRLGKVSAKFETEKRTFELQWRRSKFSVSD